MRDMWVKVCATTSLGDARLAVEAGADAVGFVLAAASRRRVTAEAVAAMTAGLRAADSAGVEMFGVFDGVDAEEIVRQARVAGLTGVQLHAAVAAEERVAQVLAVRAMAPELAVMAVVHWEVGAPDAGERVREEMAALRAAGVRRVLLDSKVGAAAGGTGVRFDWAEAAEALMGVREGVDLVVAGGLRAETVGQAIRELGPFGVDVASGVEAAVGEKSPERVRAFLAAARG